MKHIRVGNAKQYAFCAIDPYTKQSLIHVASTPSSQNAKVAIEKILTVFGRHITILNDNGSENFGKVYSYLQDQNITQYFARPHTPKDKPYIENLIGKLQQECLDEDDRTTKTIAERQAQINRWLNDYHFFRPHQSLNYQTPQEFCDTLGLTIPRLEVCAMW
jgi:putative transposase